MYRYVPTAIAALAVAVLLGTLFAPIAGAQGPAWCPYPGAYYGDSWLSNYYSSYSYGYGSGANCYNQPYYGQSYNNQSNYYQPYSQYYPQAYFNYCYLPPQQVAVKPAKVKTIYVQQPTPEPVYVYVQQPYQVQQPQVIYVQPTPCPAPQTIYVQPAPAPCPVVETAFQVPTCGAIPHDIAWGSFGTYDNWARAFEQQHCRFPTAQDECDFWWSQQYASRTGVSPFTATWCWDCEKN